MNLILLFPNDFTEDRKRVRLEGRRLRHIQQVHRASAGDTLRVGLLGGRMGSGLVIQMNETVLEMEVVLNRDPPPPLPVTLILALPRPKVLRRVLLFASSMGVKRIILLNTWRVEKSFWKSPALQEDKMKESLILGLEQACDTVLPEVRKRPLFKPFVEDELPGIMKGTLPLVAHLGEVKPCPRNLDCSVTLAVGPEGGFIPYEIEKLMECGFQAVVLGERILRVESAVPALLSRLF